MASELAVGAVCTIDPFTREITVPQSMQLLGVESDQRAGRIPFRCPKVVGDNIDLSELSIRINYRNANGEKDRYIVQDTANDGDDITFSWQLTRRATAYKGDVNFIVCAVKTNAEGNVVYEWNTTLAKARVLEGLEVEQPVIDEPVMDVIQQLLDMTKAESEKAVQAVNTAGLSRLSEINAAGERHVNTINQAGTSNTKSVNDAGTQQTASINNTGAQQTTSINNAGSAQIAAVNRAGTEQVQAVEAAAAEIIADRAQITQNADAITDIAHDVLGVAGLEVDYENATFTRLAGAVGLQPGTDFDRFRMFGGRRRCTVSDYGVITSWYGDSNYVEDGSIGQVMVYQPKFYYKVIPVKTEPQDSGVGYHLRKARYYVSDHRHDGFKLHPDFYDAYGREVDYVLKSAYEGCIYDESEGAYILDDAQVMDAAVDKFSSVSGAKPASGKTQQLTRPNVEQMAQNRGCGWHCETVKDVSAEQLLMIVETGTMNLQQAIGQGVVSIADSPDTENNSIVTGGTSGLGNDTGMANGENGKVSVTYRGAENMWGNIWKFVYGVNIYANNDTQEQTAYVCTDFNFAESKNSGNYEHIGFNLPVKDGYISAMGYNEAYDWILLPSETIGNSSSPVGDYTYCNVSWTGYRIARLGGYWLDGGYAGGFDWYLRGGVGFRDHGIGGRLVYIPTAAPDKYTTDDITKTAIKGTASGSTITVHDSAECSLVDSKIYGRSEQVQTTGAQLFGASKIASKSQGGATVINNGDGSFTVSGSGTLTGTFKTSYYLTKQEVLELFKAPGKYTLSASSITMPTAGITLRRGVNGESICDLGLYSSKIKTVNLTQEILDVEDLVGDVYFYGSPGVAIVPGSIQPMLNAGSTPLPWEPYTGGKPSPSPEYPQEIEGVGDSGEITEYLTGANLFDASKIASKSQGGATVTDNGDGSFTVSGSGALTSSYMVEKFFTREETLRLLSGTGMYTLSGGKSYPYLLLSIYDVSTKKNIIEWNLAGASSLTKGLNVNIADNQNLVLRIGFWGAMGNTISPATVRPMFNEGSTSLPWEPYKLPQKLTIPIPNGLHGIPVTSDGNYTDVDGQQWVCDVVCEQDGQVGVLRNCVRDLVTSVDVVEMSQASAFGHTVDAHHFKACDWNIAADALCDSLAIVGYNKMNKHDEAISIKSTVGETGWAYCIKISGIEQTLSAYNTYLAGHPVEIVAIRGVPMFEPFAADVQAQYRALKTYYPTTAITNSDNANMEITYITDTQTYVDNKISAAIEALRTSIESQTAAAFSYLPPETQAAMIENETADLLKESEELL